MNNKSRILLVAYNFPPLISPQSLRWFYLVRELSKMEYTIDVLTISMPAGFRDLLGELPASVNVHRTFPGPFYYATFRRSREVENRKNGPGVVLPLSPPCRIISELYHLSYRILNALPVPDAYTEWLPFALCKGMQLLKTKDYDFLISSSEPRICHVVAYFLKGKSGIPWIADYGDPWIYLVPTVREPALKIRSLRKIETRLLKEMDSISVAAEGIGVLYGEKYPFLDGEKIKVVQQGFDPEFLSRIKEERSPRFRIVYCGSFYKSLRDPGAFFEAIKRLDIDDIEVVIAGRINEFSEVVKERGLSDKVAYRGFLDHKESLALEKGATVLLHIGNVLDIQVPGKIYEYLGTLRPILCIRGGGEDLSAQLVMRYNRGIVVMNDREQIEKGIIALYDLWKSGRLEESFSHDMPAEFTWKRGAEKFADILKIL